MKTRTKRRNIWREIVEYANGDTASDATWKSLKALFLQCLNDASYKLSDINEVDAQSVESDTTVEEAFRILAKRDHAAVRNLLTWLCRPKERSDLAPKAVEFLQENNSGLTWDLYDVSDRAATNNSHPIFFSVSVRVCASIMNPICKFLIDRIREFQEGELTLREAIPIRMCEKKDCDKFKLPERQKATCYCSNSCRSAAHQSKRLRSHKAAGMRRYSKTAKRSRKL